MSVELDLNKPLISKFFFDDKVHRVEYEGLHIICFECGIFGHKKEHCPSAVQAAPQDKMDTHFAMPSSTKNPSKIEGPIASQDVNVPAIVQGFQMPDDPLKTKPNYKRISASG